MDEAVTTSEAIHTLQVPVDLDTQDATHTINALPSLMASPKPFGETLAERVAKRESQIVLGLDPHPALLWPGSDEGINVGVGIQAPSQLAARAMVNHCRMVVDAVASSCVAVKLQLACFERVGAPGWEALAVVAEYAHNCGLLVIADGKRGDIDVTAQAYSESLFDGLETPFGRIHGLDADLVCVNPLMGQDAVVPFIKAACRCGAGVLVLVRTSNPSAVDVEDLVLVKGEAVWERLAGMVNQLGRQGVASSGLSNVGAVVGATAPQHLGRARELMPHAIFLLPGVGAQGGRVDELAPAFAPGRAGGLITASRGIAEAFRANGGDPAQAARDQAERLRELAWAISE